MVIVLGDMIADISMRIGGMPVNATDIQRISYMAVGPGGATNVAIAAARFGLRVAWTWVVTTLLLGATLVLTATTDVAGLPALPAVCFGFLLPNADLLWRKVRDRRGA